MTGLDRRIQKADKLTLQDDTTCERCGSSLLPGAEKPTEYIVAWDDGEIWEEDDPAEDEEVFCEACGTQLTYTVTWDADEETPPQVLAWMQERREQARAQELLAGLEFGVDEEER